MIKGRFNTDNLFNPDSPLEYHRFIGGTKDYWMMRIPLEAGTYAINAIATGSDYYYIRITDQDLNVLRNPTTYFITPTNITKCTFSINEGEILWIFDALSGGNKLNNIHDHNIMLNKGTTYKKYVPYIQEIKRVYSNGHDIRRVQDKSKIFLNIGLPIEYKRVEFLESTGTQFINLPFGFNKTDEVEAEFSITLGQSVDKYIVSPSTWNNAQNRFALGVNSGRFNCAYGGQTTTYTYLSPIKANDGFVHKWIYKNYLFIVEDLSISYDASSVTFGSESKNLKLFFGYNSNTKGKVKYYKHIKNGVVVFEGIPCYRKSDNVAGLYDMVSNTFFTNDGTGEFIVGDIT